MRGPVGTAHLNVVGGLAKARGRRKTLSIRKSAEIGGPDAIAIPEIVAYRAIGEVDIFINFFSEVFRQLQRCTNLPLRATN